MIMVVMVRHPPTLKQVSIECLSKELYFKNLSFQCSDATSKRIARKIFSLFCRFDICLLFDNFRLLDHYYLTLFKSISFHQGMALMRENAQKLFCQVFISKILDFAR